MTDLFKIDIPTLPSLPLRTNKRGEVINQLLPDPEPYQPHKTDPNYFRYQDVLHMATDAEIMQAGEQLIQYGLSKHNKLFVLRLDIHLPYRYSYKEYAVLSDPSQKLKDNKDCFAHGKALISAFCLEFQKLEEKAGYDPCYLVVRECKPALNGNYNKFHYHMLLCVNGSKTKRIYNHIENARKALDTVVVRHCDSYTGAKIYDCNDYHNNGTLLHRGVEDSNLANVRRQISYLSKLKTKEFSHVRRFFMSNITAKKQHQFNLYHGILSTDMSSYLMDRTNDVFDYYMRHHLQCMVIHLELLFPKEITTQLISEFQRRLMIIERRRGFAPHYFMIRSSERHHYRYNLFLFLEDNVTFMPYSHVQLCCKILSQLTDMPCYNEHPMLRMVRHYQFYHDKLNLDRIHDLGMAVRHAVTLSDPDTRSFSCSQLPLEPTSAL